MYSPSGKTLAQESDGQAAAADPKPAPAASFARNSVTTFLTGIFALAVGGIQVGITARILGPTGKGALTAALLIPQLLAVMAPLGIDWASLYHLGKKSFHRETLVRTVLGALLIQSGVGTLVCLAASYVLRDRLFEGV